MMNSIEKRDVKKQLIHGIYRVCKHLFLKEILKKKNRMHGNWHLVYAMEENSPL